MQTVNKASLSGMEHMLYFTASGVRYCLPVNTIERIIPLVSLQKLPTSPNYLCGMLNLHGQPVPTIDISLLLDLDNPDPYTVDNAIIICESEPRVGIIVPEVVGVLDFVAEHCFEHTNEHTKQDASLPTPILASIVNNDDIVYVLNMQWIYDQLSGHLQTKPLATESCWQENA